MRVSSPVIKAIQVTPADRSNVGRTPQKKSNHEIAIVMVPVVNVADGYYIFELYFYFAM